MGVREPLSLELVLKLYDRIFLAALQRDAVTQFGVAQAKKDLPVRSNMERFAKMLRDHPAPLMGEAVDAFLRFIPRDDLQEELANRVDRALEQRRIQASVFVIMHVYEVRARSREVSRITRGLGAQAQPRVNVVTSTSAPRKRQKHTGERNSVSVVATVAPTAVPPPAATVRQSGVPDTAVCARC